MNTLLLTLGFSGFLEIFRSTILASAAEMVSRGDFSREFPELGYKLELLTLDSVCSCGSRGAIFRLTIEFGNTTKIGTVTLPADEVRRAQGRAIDRTAYVN